MSRFVNFGTYNSTEADWLKNELEKAGIPVKVQYPGTEIGRESSGGANWTAMTLLVPEIELARADKIRERLRIKPVVSIRISDIIYNPLNRISIGAILLLWLMLYVAQLLPEGFISFIAGIKYFDIVYFSLFLVFLVLIFANTFIRLIRFYLKK